MNCTCPHCGQPLLVIPCRDCDGAGGWWCDAPSASRAIAPFAWRSCPTCHDQRTEAVCTNLDCPSKVWYPLRRAQQRVMEDEKR